MPRTTASRKAPSERNTNRRSAKVAQVSDSMASTHIQAKTVNQQRLLDAIEAESITVALGCAGTGKTFCSVMKVAQLYRKGNYDNIIMARSIVGTGKSNGFLPGDLKDKQIPWLQPMISVLERAFGKSQYEYMFAKDIVSIQPLEMIRGRSFENTLMLIDEAQNLNFEEMKAITTRLGENSKMILMGDTFQSDLEGDSALLAFCNMCERHGIRVPVIEFGVEDIVRSDIVAQLVKMFMHEAKFSRQNRDNKR